MKTTRSITHPSPRRRAQRTKGHLVEGRAEILVGTSFRFWLTGFRTGDLTYWQSAFDFSARTLGTEHARLVCSDFSHWVKMLSARSRRELQALSPDAPGYGRDECVAMAVFASYQHRACPALQACAITLLGCEPSPDLADLSFTVADRLQRAEQVLSERSLEYVIEHATTGVRLPV